MQKLILLFACALACAGLLPTAARSGDTASPTGTPPPQIYHVVTTALCARLHEVVRPAVAMILQNDQTIGKSPPLFKKYQRGTLAAQDSPNTQWGTGAPSNNGDSMNNQSPETSMALQQMSYLVIPIARNLIAAQTTLDQKMSAPTGNVDDDATLAQIKQQLLETVAFQSASLDLINGFVQTQQMGELQHVGQEYLGAIQGTDTTDQPIQATPNPWQDPNTPGLAPNPYAFDVSTVPGLAVGYNPLSRVMDGLQWLQTETQKRENAAGKTIEKALAQCPK